jgi:hypothetical protein
MRGTKGWKWGAIGRIYTFVDGGDSTAGSSREGAHEVGIGVAVSC